MASSGQFNLPSRGLEERDLVRSSFAEENGCSNRDYYYIGCLSTMPAMVAFLGAPISCPSLLSLRPPPTACACFRGWLFFLSLGRLLDMWLGVGERVVSYTPGSAWLNIR